MLLMGSFFDFLLQNLFVQSLGVGTLAYLTLLDIDWVIIFLLRILETFSQWYRWHASPYAFQIALGMTVLYIIWQGVFSSRRN